MQGLAALLRLRLPRARSLPVPLRRFTTATALIVLLAWTAPNLSGGGVVHDDVFEQAELIARPKSFSIVGWEIGTLANVLGHRIRAVLPFADRPELSDSELVGRFFSLGEELARARSERDRLWARAASDATASTRLAEIEDRIAALEAERDELQPWVEDILAGQVSAQLTALGLRTGLIEWEAGRGPTLTPDVFFTFSELPNAFVVAPRDKIEIRSSLLLDPDLRVAEMEELESHVDALGVSSLAFGVGGFAAFPSMVPDTTSLRGTLETIAHEWVHHYLAFRPLGQAYFGDYRMRAINETVADIVGDEVAAVVYSSVYSPEEAPAQPSVQRAQPSRQEGPDFGTEMRRIRAEVERFLAAGDVAGAEAYMAEQQQYLAELGFYVRKLNTAYLSFFGSYTGGGNSWEPKLRELRERSESLQAFLKIVSSISTPEELDRLLAAE